MIPHCPPPRPKSSGQGDSVRIVRSSAWKRELFRKAVSMTRILEKADVVVSPEHCKGCGLCVEVCPKEVLFLRPEFNSQGYHPADYTGVSCNG